ncbi:MAG: DNA internalization-related competence protein ComEC/Rec2 [Cellvibrionaceae bacterium]
MNVSIAIVCTVVGIISVGFFPTIQLPYNLSLIIPFLVCIFAFIFSCFIAPTFYPQTGWLKKLHCIGFIAVGIFWGLYCGKNIINSQLTKDLEGQEFWIEGVVSDLPEDKGRYQRFVFSLDDKVFNSLSETISFQKIKNQILPKTLLLSWYGGQHVSVGDRWRFKVKLKRPRGSVNEGGFDYQRWLLGQGIGATGYIKKSTKNAFLESTYKYPVNQIREKIRDWIGEIVNQTENDNFIANNFLDNKKHYLLIALAIGDNSFITQEQWNLLRSTGTSHLMAISGLHIGLMATVGFWIGLGIRALFSLRYSLSTCIYYFPSITSIVFSLSYASLAGFSLSTQRALVMVIVANITLMVHRKVGSFLPFLWALLAVVLLDPLAGYELGFWLSFTAVGSLLYAFSYRLNFYSHNTSVEHQIEPDKKRSVLFTQISKPFWKLLNWVRQLTRSQWVVFIGLMLPLYIMDLSSSFVSPIANFMAIPWVSFTVVIPLLVSLVFYLVSLVLDSMNALITFDFIDVISSFLNIIAVFFISFSEMNMTICMDLLEKLNVHSITIVEQFFEYQSFMNLGNYSRGIFPNFSLLLGVFGVLIILAPKGISYKWLGLILVLPFFFSRSYFSFDVIQQITPMHFFKRMPLMITVLDVGQGLAVVVRVGDRTLLYDTGPGSSEGFNAGQAIILPYFKSQSINKLDTLVVSHNDNDHSGGMISLLQSQVAIKQFIYGEKITFSDAKKILAKKETDSFICEEDAHWQWDDVDFYLIEPKGGSNKKERNNQSCVLIVSYKDKHILIPGDIEKSVEQILLRNNQMPSNIALLIAPHHGSLTSSTASFVNYVKPEFVAFSAGYNSRYGHPHHKVVQRYQRVNSTMLNTGEQGQLQFYFDEEGVLTTKQWRKDYRRYWFSED